MNKLDVDRDMTHLAYLMSLMTADMADSQMREEDTLVIWFEAPAGKYKDRYPFAYAWASRLSLTLRKARAQMGGHA